MAAVALFAIGFVLLACVLTELAFSHHDQEDWL